MICLKPPRRKTVISCVPPLTVNGLWMRLADCEYYLLERGRFEFLFLAMFIRGISENDRKNIILYYYVYTTKPGLSLWQ
jgi:hypothetical protein